MPLCIHCNQYVEDNSEAGMTKGFGVARIAEMPLDLLSDEISNQLFDPGGWHEEFNKLAEMEQ